ncbi:MAG: helix-turn-helix domain-containing protein [Acidobacteria bacterium]|nr:helix-turn-helix domain-containing protein [Acidobacteriota bacterium]
MELMTPQEVAKLTGLSLDTLSHWRSKKKNIPYLKVGRCVMYDKRDVEGYLERCRVEVSKGRRP